MLVCVRVCVFGVHVGLLGESTAKRDRFLSARVTMVRTHTHAVAFTCACYVNYASCRLHGSQKRGRGIDGTDYVETVVRFRAREPPPANYGNGPGVFECG